MPEVLDGYRAPRDERLASSAATAKRGSGLKTIPEGKRVFWAIANRYRVQLTAPDVQKLPDGRIIQDRAITAKFDEGYLTLDTSKERDKRTIELLETHPDFGKDFGDYAVKLAEIEARTVAFAAENLSAIAATPEGRAKLKQALAAAGDDEFQIPSSTTAPAPLKPIGSRAA